MANLNFNPGGMAFYGSPAIPSGYNLYGEAQTPPSVPVTLPDPAINASNGSDLMSDLYRGGAGGFGGMAAAGAGGFNWASLGDLLKSAVGTKEAPGWGGLALGAAGGLSSAFMGMKQYGLAKQSLEQNKQQFQAQYAAQRGLTNSNLEDRQRARVASNPTAYESVGDYMAKNGVK